jgi:predicted DNA-binding protein (UPF0251 family)
MSRKRTGKKALKGIPLYYDELKRPHAVDLTDTAWTAFTQAAAELGVSRSQVLEELGRKGVEWLVTQAKESTSDEGSQGNQENAESSKSRE